MKTGERMKREAAEREAEREGEGEREGGVSLWAIDSIRHPAEVAALQSASLYFTLIGVSAPTEVRFERLVERGRAGDSLNFADFSANEAAELKNASETGQQLGEVLRGANFLVENGGSLAEFEREVERVMGVVEREIGERGVVLKKGE